MPLKRRPGKAHVSSELTTAEWSFLRDEPMPPDAGFDEQSASWAMAKWGDEDENTFREGRPSVRAMWQELGESITAEHAQASPGMRPSCWWRFDAPEQRRRLGSSAAEPSWPIGHATACPPAGNGHGGGRRARSSQVARSRAIRAIRRATKARPNSCDGMAC